jgi:hypothetical protein
MICQLTVFLYLQPQIIWIDILKIYQHLTYRDLLLVELLIDLTK